MGSLRVPSGVDVYESKKHNLLQLPHFSGADAVGFNSWLPQLRIRYVMHGRKGAAANARSDTLFACHGKLKTTGEFIKTQLPSLSYVPRMAVKPSSRLKNVIVGGFEASGRPQSTPASVINSQLGQFDDVATDKRSPARKTSIHNMKQIDKYTSEPKSGRRLWNRFQSFKKAVQRRASRRVPTIKSRPFNDKINDTEDDDSLLSADPEFSIEKCNSVLKLLEKNNDEKTMSFFEWMIHHGKLKRNPDAYHLAIRVLARKEDWYRAKVLLEEMTAYSDCKLNVQNFNVLIYICSKRRLVRWGTKWFQMMLEKEVQPNVATIGMLMGLYQKSGSVSEAEFTFSYMRSLKIQCTKAYSAMITIYTRLGLHEKSEEVISLMEKDQLSPDMENWLVRLNAYCQQGKLAEAETCFKAMLKSGFLPNIVAYNTLITGYGKLANTMEAERVFKSLKSVGLKPDEATYRSMIECFGRTDDCGKALLYYKKLKDSGSMPNSSNFFTMINLLVRHSNDEGVIEILKDMKLAGCQLSSILSNLLQTYEKDGMVVKVLAILQASFYEDILLDATSCSIVVMSYVQNSLVNDALQVLKDKKWEDSDFEDNLYHLLICSCKEAGSYDNAIQIYEHMRNTKNNLNLHITCSMIDIYCAIGRFADAENLYLKLKESNVTFDMVAYSIVVRMYIKAGSLENASSVLNLMEKQKDIVPDTFLFRDMLRTYQQCKKLEKLADTYYWLSRCDILWDEAMYNCVINCCGHALPVDEVSRLFDEMIHCGYAANVITLNVLLDVYGKAGLFRKARKVFMMAKKQGLADIITYNTIIAAYGKAKDFKSMKYFVKKMQHAGFSISLEAYNCMLDAYGKVKRIEEFNDVLQKMKEAHCTSDHYTYNIMINIYGKMGWIEEVANVLAELKEHGKEPDLYSYNTLIKAYGNSGLVEEAVTLVQEMRAKGFKPDRVTYTNLITVLQKNEKFLEAVKWSLWMKHMEPQFEPCTP